VCYLKVLFSTNFINLRLLLTIDQFDQKSFVEQLQDLDIVGEDSQRSNLLVIDKRKIDSA